MAAEEKHDRSRYRRGCKCGICRKANSDYLKEYRVRKKAEQRALVAPAHEPVALADVPSSAPQPDQDRAPGEVEQALADDVLEKEPTFRKTLLALARANARFIDQVYELDRVDLLSPIQARLVEQLKMLLPKAPGGSGPTDDEKMLAALELMANGGA
jgi:hypothetical protein